MKSFPHSTIERNCNAVAQLCLKTLILLSQGMINLTLAESQYLVMHSVLRPKYVLMLLLMEKKFRWKTNLYHMIGRNSEFFTRFLFPASEIYFCHKKDPPKWVVNLLWLDEEICDTFLRLMLRMQRLNNPLSRVKKTRELVRHV